MSTIVKKEDTALREVRVEEKRVIGQNRDWRQLQHQNKAIPERQISQTLK